jgi:hypothetical protein
LTRAARRSTPVESNRSNTPLGAAIYSQHQELIDPLSRYSRDIWEPTYAGKIDGSRSAGRGPRCRARVGRGNTPLMWLQLDDESCAMAVAKLLIEMASTADQQ